MEKVLKAEQLHWLKATLEQKIDLRNQADGLASTIDGQRVERSRLQLLLISAGIISGSPRLYQFKLFWLLAVPVRSRVF